MSSITRPEAGKCCVLRAKRSARAHQRISYPIKMFGLQRIQPPSWLPMALSRQDNLNAMCSQADTGHKHRFTILASM